MVIGGSSGAAVAKLAATEGTRVAITSSNLTRVANAVVQLKANSPNTQITGYTRDLGHEDVEEHLEKLFTNITNPTELAGRIGIVAVMRIECRVTCLARALALNERCYPGAGFQL